MALTVAEANAVHQLLGWMLGIDTGRQTEDLRGDLVDWPVTCGGARDAAELLADHAHQKLMTGPTGAAVRDAWAALTAPAGGCDGC